MKKMFAALAILVAGLVAFVLLSTNPVTDTVSVVPATQASHPQDLPSFQTATGEAVPLADAMFNTDLEANAREPCPNPVTAFLERVTDLRSLHDEVPEELEKVLRETEDVVTTSRVLNGTDTLISEQRATDVWFQELRRCANLRGEDELLKIAVLTTFGEETREPLEGLWLGFLDNYEPCDADIFPAIHGKFETALVSGLPAWSEAYRIRLSFASTCPAFADEVLLDMLALATLAEGPMRDQYWNDLKLAFPYTPRIGKIMLEAAHDPRNAYGVTEAFRWYASSGQLDLPTLLGDDPNLVDTILGGEKGGATWAMAELLARFGGDWGASVLQGFLANPETSGDRRSDLLGFLGDPDTSIPWSFFQLFTTDSDPQIAAAGFGAIGQKARKSDEAYAWLRAQASATSDPEMQIRALEGLGFSARAGVGDFLVREVLPVARGPAKAKAVDVYAFQKDADPDVLANLFRVEQDPNVRAAAAWGHLLAGGDAEATGQLVEGALGGPVQGVSLICRLAAAANMDANAFIELHASEAKIAQAEWWAKQMRGHPLEVRYQRTAKMLATLRQLKQ